MYRPLHCKQIEKSVIIIIYEGGISSPTSFLGFYFGEGGGIAKSAIAIVLEKLVGFARALAIYNIQIQISVIVIVPPGCAEGAAEVKYFCFPWSHLQRCRLHCSGKNTLV